MLKQRIITAIILIPIMLCIVIFFPPKSFLIATALMALIGSWEWAGLMGLKRIPARTLYLLLMMLIFFNCLFLPVQLILTIGVIWWIVGFVLVAVYPRASAVWGNSVILRGLMGIMTLTPCWVAINFIRYQQDGLFALLFLFILIWGADTTAYFVGKKWGRNKLARHASPGKTVQGAVGALIFALIVTVVALWCFETPLFIWHWGVMLSMVTVVASIVGDLFESIMKRQVGVKDSGSLLPGHGGLLDRIDSLTAAAPVYAFGAWLLNSYLGG